jgi:Protein of unknown function (DUF3800)
MAFFNMYVDESGKLSNKTNEFTCLCGYVAAAEEWHRIALEWNSLRFRWKIPPIHMSQIFSPSPRDVKWKGKREEWGKHWELKRDLMLAEFAVIIRSASAVCVGSVVDASAYREVAIKPDHRLPNTDSNVFAFHNTIMRALDRIEVVDKWGQLGIVVDDDPEHATQYYDLLQTLKQTAYEGFQKVRDRVTSISFSENPEFPGLQAADMIAWESRNFARSLKENPDAEPSDFFANLTHLGTNQPQFYSSKWIHKIAAGTASRLKEQEENAQTERV